MNENLVKEIKDLCEYESEYENLKSIIVLFPILKEQELIKKFREEINLISSNRHINLWHCICLEYQLSDDFIREFQNEIDWHSISRKQLLSPNFVREFKNRICWNCYSHCQLALSEGFIREFQNEVNWIYISGFQRLSEEFIMEFENKVYWDKIFQFQNLSEKFIKENKWRIKKII